MEWLLDVFTATNGLEGIEKAKQLHPDLIVLDFMMPSMDGYEVCENLRVEPETAQVPILMLSAKEQEIDRVTGLKMGADDYVTKPWQRSELLAKIATMLERRSEAPNTSNRI